MLDEQKEGMKQRGGEREGGEKTCVTKVPILIKSSVFRQKDVEYGLRRISLLEYRSLSLKWLPIFVLNKCSWCASHSI